MKDIIINGALSRNEKEINLKDLKDTIKNIALFHSHNVNRATREASLVRREFNLANIAKKVLSLPAFNAFEEDKQIKILEESLNSLMESSTLTTDQGVIHLVPLPYEVLSVIFLETNEKFRQHFFHELINYYYDVLSENLKEIPYSKEDFDQQVKVLLPVVKFEAAFRFLHSKHPKEQTLLQELTGNLTRFLKSPRLNEEDIFEVVSNKIKSQNYELISYGLIPLDERNGHLGEYFRLTINIEYENSEKVFKLFVKFLTPTLENFKKLVQSGPSKKEEFYYLTYLPLLEKHGLKTLLDFTPQCYFSRINDVLILDDMVSLGFTALTPNIKLDIDSLMFVVKQIAKFHSCSMILEELLSQEKGRKVNLLDIYGEYFKEVLFIDSKDHFLHDSLKGALEIIHYVVPKFPDCTKNISQDDLKEKVNIGWKSLFENVKTSKEYKNTACHGDMYVSNMLFNFDDSHTCHGAVLVDFQVLRYCPPVQDLLFFIHQNTFKETRDKYYSQLLNTYYSEISKNLQEFNLDIEKIYPKEEFEQSVKHMKKSAVFQSWFYTPFNMIDPALREKIMQSQELANKYFQGSKTALIDLGLESDDYRNAIRGLVLDTVELYESGLL